MRLAKVFADQRSVDIDLVALDDRVRTWIEVIPFVGSHVTSLAPSVFRLSPHRLLGVACVAGKKTIAPWL